MSANWEYQSPEVIAKELLIAYIEKSSFFVDFEPVDDNKNEEIGLSIGKAYNALLAEIKKSF